MLQAHYRSILDFSDEAIAASEKGFNRLMEAVELVPNLKPSETSTLDIETWKTNCYDALNDDFNTPILIAHLFEAAKYINLINDGKESLSSADLTDFSSTIHAFLFEVLGIKNTKDTQQNTDKTEGVIELLIQMRNEARANKNFALSDEIRDKLLSIGVQLKDGKDGTSFSFV